MLQSCLVVTWLVPYETAAVSAHFLCTPHNHAPCTNVVLKEVVVFGEEFTKNEDMSRTVENQDTKTPIMMMGIAADHDGRPLVMSLSACLYYLISVAYKQ